MNTEKLTAQKTIEDAAMTIGLEGTQDFVFALSQVLSVKDHARAAIAIAGDPNVIIKTLVATMRQDADFKRIMLSAVNRFMVSKIFNRAPKQCDCPDCIIERALKQ